MIRLPASTKESQMKARAAVTVVALLAIYAAAFAQGPGPRRDGKWEVTIEMDVPGMPMQMQPVTTTHCVTKEQANDPRKMIPSSGRGGRGRSNDNCKMTDQKFEGNKATWSMSCPDQGMNGSGEFTYTQDAYVGTVKMDMTGRGTMTMKYTGKRLGDCDQ